MIRVFAATLSLFLLASTVLADQSPGLGQKDPGLLNLRGSIYFLDDAASMPDDLAKRKVDGVIYADKLDVPERSFTEGFPGVTDRFEWFGVLYEGNFETPIAGTYGFKLSSDDGSRLFIDGTQVIDNDGVHGTNDVSGSIDLTRGRHTMKVWYFQGPATEIALQLWITPPKGKEKIFSLADYSQDADVTAELLDAGRGAQAKDYDGKAIKGRIVLAGRAVRSCKVGSETESAALDRSGGDCSAGVPRCQSPDRRTHRLRW